MFNCYQTSRGYLMIIKKSFSFGLGVILFLAAMPISFGQQNQNQSIVRIAALYSNLRQITFVGPRAGEGYFNKDGSKMIFQSERSKQNPFYQIFLMDLKSGKTDLISSGDGQTTCAWVHPDGNRVMYSSTHLDPLNKEKVKQEFDKRANPQKQKYSWAYDDQFDIFEVQLSSGGKPLKTKRLTKELGYDAEGSYSPDGKKIAFASNRSGYLTKDQSHLSPDDKLIFSKDSSYLMDIYIMDSDGKNVKQLTDTKGYDGGPFFSADGQMITWRRFKPNGQSAEIMVMDVDGKNQRAITSFAKMSWAPYFHPSREYIVFTTNVHGYQNFELYIVRTDGKSEPVRVTDLDGFDGLPVFSPSGDQISWTRRNEKGESQIYIADWDHQGALKALGLNPSLPKVNSASSPDINAQDLKSWLYYFASEKLKGRSTGSPEETEYLQTIANYFKELGLKPFSGSSYLQTFDFTSTVKAGSENELKVLDNNNYIAKLGVDYNPLSFSKVGPVKPAKVVFAGYGIDAPASETEAAYNSYKDLQVQDQWVMIFRDIPEEVPNSRRIHLNTYSRIHHKALVAKQNGALGVLVIDGDSPKAIRFEGGFAETGLPVLSITQKMADRILQVSVKDLKKKLENGSVAEQAISSQMMIEAKVDLSFEKTTANNLVATIPVAGAKKTIVIGAHGDHLGLGERGNSLAKDGEKGVVHFGADDNASGMSAVIELAEYFAKNKKGLKHNLVFAIWSGEELGLLGSSHFIKNQQTEQFLAYINMDMIGRLNQNPLQIQGVGSAAEWSGLFESLNLSSAQRDQLRISLTRDPYVPTDAMAFYLKQVPAITFFTGSHAEYHSPRDRAELIDFKGLASITSFIRELVSTLNAVSTLTYQKVESSRKSMEGRSFRLYVGTIPDYSQEGVVGVRISGTSKGSPAELAGLQSGDVITEMAGTKLQNLYDYVYLLQALKADQQVSLTVQRKGQVLQLKVTPTLRKD